MRAVSEMACAIARHREARAVDHHEGAFRFRRIVEIAERHEAALRPPAHSVVAGFQHPRQRLVDNDVVGTRHEFAGARAGHLVADLRALPACFRRAESVDDHDVRQQVENLRLDRRVQRRAARENDAEARQVVFAVPDRVDDRPRECIADDLQEVDLLAFDQRQDVRRVEPFDVALDEHGVALVQGGQRNPVTGAVHIRRGREHLHADRLRALDVLVERFQDLSVCRAAAQCRYEYVGLPPENALRHTGGATGIEDVEIVRRRLALRLFVGALRQHGLIVDGAGQQRVAGVVGHLNEHFQRRHLGANRGHARRKVRVIDDRASPRVVQQINEFLFDVPVVDVERRHSRLVTAEHAFEVFVAVEQIQRELVLSRLPALERGAWRSHAEPARHQVVGEPPRAIVELAERDASIAKHDRFLIRKRGRNGFADCPQVEHDPCRDRSDRPCCPAASRM